MSTDRERRWVDGYRLALYEQLAVELEDGWRGVTDLHPQDCPQPVRVTAENVIPIRRHYESRSWTRKAIS